MSDKKETIGGKLGSTGTQATREKVAAGVNKLPGWAESIKKVFSGDAAAAPLPRQNAQYDNKAPRGIGGKY
jgi:hypothetical protein